MPSSSSLWEHSGTWYKNHARLFYWICILSNCWKMISFHCIFLTLQKTKQKNIKPVITGWKKTLQPLIRKLNIWYVIFFYLFSFIYFLLLSYNSCYILCIRYTSKCNSYYGTEVILFYFFTFPFCNGCHVVADRRQQFKIKRWLL